MKFKFKLCVHANGVIQTLVWTILGVITLIGLMAKFSCQEYIDIFEQKVSR